MGKIPPILECLYTKAIRTMMGEMGGIAHSHAPVFPEVYGSHAEMLLHILAEEGGVGKFQVIVRSVCFR